MLKNYFKIAWRTINRNKAHSALNIAGLAIGMTAALIIGLWVFYQVSYDRFLPGYEHVYTARLSFINNGEIGVGPASPLPLADALKHDVPGVKYVAQADWISPHSLVAGEKKIYQEGATASADFLKVFPFPFVQGNADQALQSIYSIVLTASTAKALFGDADPMNKMVRVDNNQDMKVTAVIKDIPANSTLQFNYIIPLAYLQSISGWAKGASTNWRDKSFQTFVRLDPAVSYAQVEPALKSMMKKYSPEDYKLFQVGLFFQPMKNWHFYTEFKNGVESGGLIEYVKIFGLTGLLILLIACINFINLSTARSEKRAREVGIRKAIGSHRKQLIVQFLVESMTVTVIAFLLSLLLVQFLLPFFNTLTSSSIHIPYTNTSFWLLMIGYILFTGITAGSRPAFYLSSFKPVKVLKGTIRTGSAAVLSRKILVVTQFTCSVALIIGTIIIYQQVQHAKDRPKGYDSNRLMMTDASADLNRNYNAFRNELLQSGMVTAVTKSSAPATALWANTRIDHWQTQLPGETMDMSVVGVCDADYFKTLGMQLKEGRNFEPNGADSFHIIVNEAAVERMHFKSAINQELRTDNNISTIIGVVKDALMVSPFAAARPTMFVYSPGWSNIISYRLSPTVSTKDAIAKLSVIFNKYNPSYPYLYHFVDETYAAKFSFENLIGQLAGLFAAIAIFISCLGLLGLAAFMAEKRNKEIGIRKVLGASVPQVWLLLSKDFILLVIISCVIASPLAFYFLKGWLEKYTYRITITPGVFIAAGLAAVIITIVTVSFQAIRAALSNPVSSLRSE